MAHLQEEAKEEVKMEFQTLANYASLSTWQAMGARFRKHILPPTTFGSEKCGLSGLGELSVEEGDLEIACWLGQRAQQSQSRLCQRLWCP